MTRTLRLSDDDHALDRFLERHREKGYPRETARAELVAELATATFREHPPGEEQIWETRSGILLVVHDNGEVSTVLPPGTARRRYVRPRR